MDGRKSVFGQIFRQVHFERPATLRTGGRPFKVTYSGEGGEDAGAYAIGSQMFFEELISTILPL